MADDLGNEVAVPTKTESAPKPPEIKLKFDDARKLGARLTNIDGYRRQKGFSSFREDPLLGEFSRSLVDVPDEELTEEKVLEAKKGSFGITLEGAKQVKDKELIEPRGINDEPDSLKALSTTFSESSQIAEELKAANPDAYREVAKKVIGAELGKKPEDVVLDDENITNWVNNTYKDAASYFSRKAQALDAYLNSGY